MLRKLFGAAVVCAIVLGAGPASSGSNDKCEVAKQEVKRAKEALATAERDCASKSNAYAACIQRNNNRQSACDKEKEAMRAAKAKVRSARDALKFAKAKQKQACG